MFESKFLQVEFVGELGHDTGGLKREFFRLLSKAISEKYMTPTGCLQHDSVALQVKKHNNYLSL